MAHILSDRVKETTTTTGTGAITLGGAVANFRDFDTLMANTDTTNYAIVHRTANEWEVGRGTWNTGNTLTRTTVYAGTNGTSAVNLSAGTKDIFMTLNLVGRWPQLLLEQNAPVNWEAGAVTLTGTSAGVLTMGGKTFVLPPGSTSTGPLYFDSTGALQTTPGDGSLEMDATNLYATTDVGNRGYIPGVHYIRAAANRTYTSNTSSQIIFNAPTNGRLTLEAGVYRFHSYLYFSGMSATGGNRLINLLGAGTATAGGWRWQAVGFDGAADTAGAAGATSITTNTSPASVITATTGVTLGVSLNGTVDISVAGTIIPSTTMVTAAASVLTIGSYFEIWRIGATGAVSVGQWD